MSEAGSPEAQAAPGSEDAGEVERRPFGTWPSPITPETVVAGAVRLGELQCGGRGEDPSYRHRDLTWSELRPAEGGRVQLVFRGEPGHRAPEEVDLLPEGVSARSRVHEYGGGAWLAEPWSYWWFSRDDDGRIWRFDDDEGDLQPLTPPSGHRGAWRYADLTIWRDPDDAWEHATETVVFERCHLVCVREHHPSDGSEPVNEIVAVPRAGALPPGRPVGGGTRARWFDVRPTAPPFERLLRSLAALARSLPPWTDPPDEVPVRTIGPDEAPGGEPAVLVSGPDFVAAPRCSPDGRHLAWLQWDHPDMPWDAAELWVGELVAPDPDELRAPLRLERPRHLLGGSGSSVVQPEWTDDGRLLAVSDRTGWWNLVEVPLDGSPAVALHDDEVEVGIPQWVFGQRRYAVLDDGRIACAFSRDGTDHLGVLADGRLTELDAPFTNIAQVVAHGDGVALVAATPTEEATVVHVPLPPGGGAGEVQVLRPRRDLGLEPGWISAPRPISFPSAGGRTAHALFHPPTAPGLAGLEGERPPAIVTIHGGPTGAARVMLDLSTQFWTSRGFAVVDVNYGGSTGYGRPYRQLLSARDEGGTGGWGVVDVEDCAAAVRWLAERGEVDGDRLAIRGGSAGGFTALCALIADDTFAVGASLYGVTDLAALARDTHKFEARYLDRLVGPWPEAEATYAERSPVHHLDRLDTPLIVFQGLEDEVVPPSQAEALVAALAERGVEHEYHAYEGEQHGFRRAETVVDVLEKELAFYLRVFHGDAGDAGGPTP